ncbi:MAG: hypothetical protein JWR51_2509 [Devosia sp.]|uniref:gluconate 2-dehydrogenase subunit 3 family protein n=1 Tax=Devosia sp. TaxID=1871048 RepID=UPI0026054CCF|nr:gluconate 2-dehydrogenase subunit 3 family protein [Devosia sp.]MDB5529406.1 hypothetical protein [Devosia sp.]
MDDTAKPATATLLAVIDRIIPADQDPGALDLGTDHYVMAQLSSQAGLAASVWAGLAQLDDLADTRFNAVFAKLTAEQQDALIALHQQADWFAALAELTAEGFYADPANSGNRDALSWRMIGYQHRLPEGPNGPMPKADMEPGDAP